MNGYTVDATEESELDRSAYENDSAKMIFAITRLADANRLNVYQGSVPHAVKVKRRTANKAARIARRAGR